MSALLRWSVSLLFLFFPQHSTLFSFCLIFLTAISLLLYSLRARFHLPAYEQGTLYCLVEGCLLDVQVNPRKSVTCYLICRTQKYNKAIAWSGWGCWERYLLCIVWHACLHRWKLATMGSLLYFLVACFTWSSSLIYSFDRTIIPDHIVVLGKCVYWHQVALWKPQYKP